MSAKWRSERFVDMLSYRASAPQSSTASRPKRLLENFAQRAEKFKSKEATEFLQAVEKFDALRELGHDKDAAEWQKDDWANLVGEIAKLDDDFPYDTGGVDDDFDETITRFNTKKQRLFDLVSTTWNRWSKEFERINHVSRKELMAFDKDLELFVEATGLAPVPKAVREQLEPFEREEGVAAFLEMPLDDMVRQQRLHAAAPQWSEEAEATLASLDLQNPVKKHADELYEELAAKFMATMRMDHNLWVMPRRTSQLQDVLRRNVVLSSLQKEVLSMPKRSTQDAKTFSEYLEDMMQLRDILFWSDGEDRTDRIGNLFLFWKKWYENTDNPVELSLMERLQTTLDMVYGYFLRRMDRVKKLDDALFRRIALEKAVRNLKNAMAEDKLTERELAETIKVFEANQAAGELHPKLYTDAKSLLANLTNKRMAERKEKAAEKRAMEMAEAIKKLQAKTAENVMDVQGLEEAIGNARRLGVAEEVLQMRDAIRELDHRNRVNSARKNGLKDSKDPKRHKR